MNLKPWNYHKTSESKSLRKKGRVSKLRLTLSFIIKSRSLETSKTVKPVVPLGISFSSHEILGNI